jgi:hypothetical protein
MARTTYQETMNRLLLMIQAGYPVIYIVSLEESRVLHNIVRILSVLNARRVKLGQPRKELVRWYADEGLKQVGGLAAADEVARLIDQAPSCAQSDKRIPWLELPGFPAAPMETPQGGREAPEALKKIREANAGVLANAVTVMFDVHRLLMVPPNGQDDLVRPLRNTADQLRRYYDAQSTMPQRFFKTIVIVAPTASGLSPELERDLIRVDFPLPEHAELLRILDRLLESRRLSIPHEPGDEDLRNLNPANPADYPRLLRELVASAGRGLSEEDYRSGLHMFAERGGSGTNGCVLSPAHIEDMLMLKSKTISSSALEYTPHVKIELGGLKMVTDWIEVHREAAVSADVRGRWHLPPPRGLMLTGVSGGGKSQLAKLIARDFNLALLRLDVGALFGPYIGESEERTRRALRLAEDLAPVVLWIDEIDKAFQGIGGGDSGVSARVLGQFLTWLAEKEDSVFVVATANDFETLFHKFPELGRKGRFDGIFWVDLPGDEARREIFRIYLRPEAESGFLCLDPDWVDAKAREFGIPAGDKDPPREPLDRLCHLLAHQAESLTGAEIEHAISEAKFRAYKVGSQLPAGPSLNQETLLETVQDAARSALYGPASPALVRLNELRKIAADSQWSSVT